jgi:hypothetical protein
MSRSTRLALVVGALLVVGAGSVLASQRPQDSRPGLLTASHEPEAPPSAEDVTHAVDRLAAAGIDATSERLQALAADYGLGGAIRLMAWADATGKSLANLQAMRDGGAGWGQIAHDLGVSPGLGSIMGQGAEAASEHGPENAPGQQKTKPAGDDQDEAAESPGS